MPRGPIAQSSLVVGRWSVLGAYVRFFKRTLEPTLFLSEAGVLVEALENHAFPPRGQKAAAHLQEVPVPRGAAASAIQFVHEVGVRFRDLQIFQLTYYHRAPGR